jgi:hypothetical protein
MMERVDVGKMVAEECLFGIRCFTIPLFSYRVLTSGSRHFAGKACTTICINLDCGAALDRVGRRHIVLLGHGMAFCNIIRRMALMVTNRLISSDMTATSEIILDSSKFDLGMLYRS